MLIMIDSRTCHMHLHNIGRIRRFLTADAAKILVHALIMSQMDYANALLLSASDYLIARLQRIQNAGASLITRTPRREHVTPDLINLHWLPVNESDRVQDPDTCVSVGAWTVARLSW